jgi:glycosyltransferase involved in cell wall biosynthesis
MNILITSFSFPNFKDGIYDGKFVFSEALAYAENGANVRVLTPHYDGADKVETMHERIRIFRFQYFIPKSFQVLKKPGIPIYNQRSPLAIIQIPFLCFFFALSILKHASWAEIIHAQWTATALMALPAKWIFGKKVVVTARGSDLRLLPHWVNQFIHHQVDAAIDCFGPQPRNVAYKERFSANFITLPLIVSNHGSEVMPEDMKEAVYGKPDTFIILYVGRLDYLKIRKNRLATINLIHASKMLKTKDMDFHVFYIGNGDDRLKKEMSALIEEHDLHDYVTLLGPRMDVLDYIRYCGLGVGGVAFNAVSQEFTISGKPQILVEFEYNADTPWQHGVNAIFVKLDDLADLGGKLIWAIRNREQVERLGENARNEMSKYIVNSRVGGRLYLREFQDLLD